MQRNGLARIARDGDTDQVARADNAVCRVKLDPARARQIDLHPGRRRNAGGVATVVAGEEIAGDEARGYAEPAQRLDHQERIVSAGAGARLARIPGVRAAVLMALAIAESLAD